MATTAFEVQTTAQVDLRSSWNFRKQTESKQIQTLRPGTVEDEAQTVLSSLHASEQLEKGEGTASYALVPQAKNAGSGWVYNTPHDADEVGAFLASVFEELREELASNAKSNAFDTYEPSWKPKRQDVALIASALAPGEASEEKHVAAIAFNCNSTLLASSYARTDATTWCKSKGQVALWNVASLLEPGGSAVFLGTGALATEKGASAAMAAAVAAQTQSSGKNTKTTGTGTNDATAPGGALVQVLEADSYVTSVAFHPTNPAMMAGGTYNGEVVLWNITDDQRTKPLTSVGGPLAPREPILQLRWLVNPRESREQHRYVLCSASTDGRILFWTPSNKLQEPLSGYEVQNQRRVVLGVQSMSFVTSGSGPRSVPGVQNVMLLGMESGDVFRTKPGNTIGGTAPTAAKDTSAGGLNVLEVDHFEAHRGPVHGVDCSPFFRNLFLTCSSDGSLRLFSTLERTPLLTMEPSSDSRGYLYGAMFSPTRPGVFACVSRSSQLMIYDMLDSRAKPSVVADAGGADGAPVSAMTWSKAVTDLVATGDTKGTLRLWQLSSQLCEPTELERAATSMTGVAAQGAMKQIYGFSC